MAPKYRRITTPMARSTAIVTISSPATSNVEPATLSSNPGITTSSVTLPSTTVPPTEKIEKIEAPNTDNENGPG